jgi:hypothetical protein
LLLNSCALSLLLDCEIRPNRKNCCYRPRMAARFIR